MLELRDKLKLLERLIINVLRAVKPSQKLMQPQDIPKVKVCTPEDFEANEEYLSNKENALEMVYIE